ncbi:MAG: hemolysin family protein [Calditrichia bacterium]
MEESPLIISFIFIVLLGLSAFFSGSETAFFSLSASQIQNLKKKKNQSSRLIYFLLSNSQQLLITIIVGNTIVNVTTATVAAILTHKIATAYHFPKEIIYILDVIAVSFVIMVVSEIIPKTVAVKKPIKFASVAARPVLFFYFLFFPVSFMINAISAQLQKGLMPKASKNGLSEEEIKTLVEVGAEHGTLEQEEKEMIASIFDFTETAAKEIMVPRTDMVVIEKNTTFEEIVNIIRKSGYSRIPVYSEKIDNIIGILYAKDLLPFLDRKSKTNFSLEKIIHTPYFVPENKKIHELLKDFQEEKIHMAIIVDEYGGVEGLITLEDIIEEIVGEIQDEYDKEEALYHKISNHQYICDGKIPIEELEELLGIEIEPTEDVETLSGLVLNQLQKIPHEGDAIDYNHWRITILKVDKNRIQKVRLERNPAQSKTNRE